MYSPETISTLNSRIGWGIPQDPAFVIELTEAISVGTSNRKFSNFHQLVTIENVYAAIPNANANKEKFEAILLDLRKESVLAVLSLIVDNNDLSEPNTDYSALITANAVLFDDAIGYKCAMMVLELFMSTGRKNFHERNAKLAIGNLKLELEGFRGDTGILQAAGLVQKFEKSIRKATNKLFPRKIIVQSLDNSW